MLRYYFQSHFLRAMSASEWVSCVLTLYVQPLLCIIGSVFNALCIAIFVQVQRHHGDYYRKTALVNYLLAFSLCNMLQLLLTFPVIITPALEQFIDEERFPEEYAWVARLNSRSMHLAYPALMAANYAAIWLLVLICAQRYQAICQPTSVWKKRLQFTRGSGRCIVVCLFMAALLNTVRLWELEPTKLETQGHFASGFGLQNSNDGTTTNEEEEEVSPVVVVETPLRSSLTYRVLQEGIVYGCIVYGVPMAVLLWFNYHTYRILSRHSDTEGRDGSRGAVVKQAAVVVGYHSEAEHRTALMTITVFVVFALCTSMSASLRLLMIFCNEGGSKGSDGGNPLQSPGYRWLIDLSNLLMNANALIMPVVCFLFTRGFRDLFFAIRYSPSAQCLSRNVKQTAYYPRMDTLVSSAKSGDSLIGDTKNCRVESIPLAV